MSMTFQQERVFDTQTVKDVILPYFKEWFGINETHNVLPEVTVEFTGHGDVVIQARLGAYVAAEDWAKFQEALQAYRQKASE